MASAKAGAVRLHGEARRMGWMVFSEDGNHELLETLLARERLWLAQAELEWREAAEVRLPPEVAA